MHGHRRPRRFRVLAFNLDGSFKATWGQYGSDPGSLMLPTGITAGSDGKVYAAGGDANRVVVFPPLQQHYGPTGPGRANQVYPNPAGRVYAESPEESEGK